MERYISVNKLKTIVNQLSSSPLNEWDTWGVMAVIDRTPSEDVTPVVHAHWIYKCKFNGNDEYTCSRCRRLVAVSTSVKRNHIDAVYPYCHCGAKMDEMKGE